MPEYNPYFMNKYTQQNSPMLYSVYSQGAMPVAMGNINLYNRPQVPNNGAISTVYSISIDEGNKTVLIPRVHPDGFIMSPRDAINWYKKSGQHLGKFDSREKADVYANALHEQQSKIYPNK